MIPANNSLCVVPWKQLFINEEGDFLLCCHARDGVLSDEKGVPYNVQQRGDIERARNSKLLKRVRRQMISDEQPYECHNCFDLEKQGITSFRQNMNERYPQSIQNLKAITRSDGSANTSISFLDIRFGNFCNLRCRMCDPISSRQLIEDFEGIEVRERGKLKNFTSYKNINWFKKKEIWAEIKELFQLVDQIYLAGGEPLLIGETFDFLRLIIQSGYSAQINLSYSTNLTHLPPEIFELWPRFKSVCLYVSLDGFDAINYYIRYPSKWSTIHRNLKTLENIHREINCKSIMINTTVQVYNIFQLPQLFWYLHQNFQFVIPYPHLEFVLYRPELSIQVLPLELKKSIANNLRIFIHDYFLSLPGDEVPLQFLSRVRQVISFMLQSDQTHLIPDLVSFTNALDKKRSQNILDIIPEFEVIMSQSLPMNN